MKGLDISRQFYLEYGKPLIETKCPDLMPKLAIGLVGSGSQCYGYDDDLSTDHDFEPGFCIFIPNDLSSKDEYRLEHLYNELPEVFMGFKRHTLLPGEDSIYGVKRIDDFYLTKVGSKDGELDLMTWLMIPSFYLLEATNGEVFVDDEGIFSSIRSKLSHYPHDVLLKKLAGEMILIYQSGIYNYDRCFKRNDLGACQLSVIEFVKHSLEIIYLLNDTYIPYYKWVFKGLKSLKILSNLHNDLVYLLSSDNTKDFFIAKYKLIKNIILDIINELKKQNLIPDTINDVDQIAFYLNDSISDYDLRNLNILAGTK